jgi:RNA polymerase sigma factor (sigma-70 family)
MSTSDEDLAHRAAQGEQESLVELLERYAPSVRARLAGEISQRWQSVLSEDDVMQQTYADVLRDIGKLVWHGPDSFVGWLATIAQRNLLDGIKMLEADKRGGNARRVEVPGSDESFIALHEFLAGSTSTPSRQVAKAEARSMIAGALDKLPAFYRQVVRMYDLEGRPVQEVAAALKRSPGAVFMLRARAHARLREELGAASGYFSNSA